MRKRLHNFLLEHLLPRLIRFVLFIVRGRILYISIAAVFAILIILFAIKAKKDIVNFIEFSTFSAVVLEGGLVAVCSLLRTDLQNLTEDPNKLTDNYQNLVMRYEAEPDLIWKRNKNDVLSVLPVIHVAWLSGKSITIDDHPERDYMLPDIIDKHYEELFRTHRTSKIYNNTNIRVDDWYSDETTGSFVLSTSRTTYYNSLVTNRTMDYQLEKGLSVRELLECGPMIHPLKYSSLSNHLGFNGFVESADNKIILVKRKNNVSIGKRTWGDSVGASLKTKYALNESFQFTKEGLLEGIIREIEDELGITASELVTPTNSPGNLDPITVIAAYRDMLEGGKPQLLFYAKATMSSEEINKRFDLKNYKVKKTKKNYDRAKNEIEMETDGEERYWIPTDEILSCEVRSDRLVHNGLLLKMVPSAAACVTMFAEYLRNNGKPFVRYSLGAVEQYLMGKDGCEDTCEDALFIGKRFAAVIDGATSKGSMTIDGKTPGKYAADIIVNAFYQLEHAKQKETDSPEKVLTFLDNSLKAGISCFTVEEEKDRPRASVVYIDRLNKTVVSYGDCKCRIGDIVYDHVKRIDSELSERRREIILKSLKDGCSVEELQDSDPGREAILGPLKAQFAHENQPLNKDLYGYPVLKGNGICRELINCYFVKEGQSVILCSDGYPEVLSSLQESEAALSSILEKDPLLIGTNDMKFKSTKGLQKDNVSFDDRAWIKLS